MRLHEILWRMRVVLWLIAIGLSSGRFVSAKEPDTDKKEKPPQFIRLDRDDDGKARSLDTAIVRFAKADGSGDVPSVDLVGAVHVGEKAYYEALNKAFADYDVVLYELVAPPGTKIPKGSRTGNHPVGSIQNGMKDLLALEHQLELVDYTKENMVHADMSPDQFSKSMQDRGESFWGMFFRMMGQGISQQAKNQSKGSTSDADLLLAFFDPNRAVALKRVMAEQFETMGGAMEMFSGPEGSTIITERNKVALKELARQLAAGKKRIAIFYGAGHMADMEKRLAEDFGLKRTSERWLVAWQLGESKAKKSAD